MNVITTQAALDAFCNTASEKPFICVDTEFMRESTFYSILCLIQAATNDDEVIIDPLAKGLDLTPFNALLMDDSIIKVLHAARQDRCRTAEHFRHSDRGYGPRIWRLSWLWRPG